MSLLAGTRTKAERIAAEPAEPVRSKQEILTERLIRKRTITQKNKVRVPQAELPPGQRSKKRGRPRGALDSYPRRQGAIVPAGFLTREMICEKVGLDRSEFNKLQKMGLFTASYRFCAQLLYKEEVLDTIRLRMMRTRTARADILDGKASHLEKISYGTAEGVTVMRGIREGRSLADIFVESQIHPVVIRSIVADYEHLEQSMFLPKEFFDKLRDLAIDAIFPIRSPKALLEIVTELAKKLEKRNLCSECKTNDCAVCMVCHEDAVEKAGEAPEDVGTRPAESTKEEPERETTQGG